MLHMQIWGQDTSRVLGTTQQVGKGRAHGVVAGAGGRAVRGPQRRLGPDAHHKALAAVAQQVADLGPGPLAVRMCRTGGTPDHDVSFHHKDS